MTMAESARLYRGKRATTAEINKTFWTDRDLLPAMALGELAERLTGSTLQIAEMLQRLQRDRVSVILDFL